MNRDAKILPIVAPSSPPREPDTLIDMFRKARGEIGEQAAYWAFQHAKAVGRRERADRELKRVELELSQLQYRAATMPSEVAVALLMQAAPDPIRFHRLDTAFADAVEAVEATATVLQIIATKGAPNEST